MLCTRLSANESERCVEDEVARKLSGYRHLRHTTATQSTCAQLQPTRNGKRELLLAREAMRRPNCCTRMYNRLCIRHEPIDKVQYDRSSVSMSSKWCCVLAAVCLSVILLSLDADAQPTVDDEIVTCDFARPEEVASSVKTTASNQQLMKDEMAGVKRQLADCGCAGAKSTTTTTTTTTTTNPIHSSTQSTHGTSCLQLLHSYNHLTASFPGQPG